MDQYGEVIGDNGSVEDYLKIANYFECNNEHYNAGVFFMKAMEYTQVSTGHLFNGDFFLSLSLEILSQNLKCTRTSVILFLCAHYEVHL